MLLQKQSRCHSILLTWVCREKQLVKNLWEHGWKKKRVTDKSQEGHNHAPQTSYMVIQENQRQSKGKPNFAQPTLETSFGFDDIFL